MLKGQTSIRGGIEDFLCPFTDMYITQGSGGNGSHAGTMSNDVRGKMVGVRAPYYAPCTVKCLRVYPESGQVMWQSVNKVRFANGKVDYATIMTAHDNTVDSYAGQIVKQGAQLGNMGNKGNATGVHCHIEIEQGNDTSWQKNRYGNYCFNNEVDTDSCYFMDNTNILYGSGGSWKYLKDVKVEEGNSGGSGNYINLSPNIDSWRFYDINVSPVKKNAKGFLRPKKFGGLSYKILEYRDNNATVVIQTVQYGKVKIYIYNTDSKVTTSPLYKSGNY